MKIFCAPKRCKQNRGSAGEDLWSRQCGHPGYQAKEKHIEMTSKWRASFTFPRSLDCSCRLLCWATALLPPSAANKIHTATLQGSNCNTSCSFFFFFFFPCFLSSCPQPFLVLFYISTCCKKTCLLLPLFIQVPCSHFFVLSLAQEYKECRHMWKFGLLPLLWNTGVLINASPVSAYIHCTLAWCTCSYRKDAC